MHVSALILKRFIFLLTAAALAVGGSVSAWAVDPNSPECKAVSARLADANVGYAKLTEAEKKIATACDPASSKSSIRFTEEGKARCHEVRVRHDAWLAMDHNKPGSEGYWSKSDERDYNSCFPGGVVSLPKDGHYVNLVGKEADLLESNACGAKGKPGLIDKYLQDAAALATRTSFCKLDDAAIKSCGGKEASDSNYIACVRKQLTASLKKISEEANKVTKPELCDFGFCQGSVTEMKRFWEQYCGEGSGCFSADAKGSTCAACRSIPPFFANQLVKKNYAATLSIQSAESAFRTFNLATTVNAQKGCGKEKEIEAARLAMVTALAAESSNPLACADGKAVPTGGNYIGNTSAYTKMPDLKKKGEDVQSLSDQGLFAASQSVDLDSSSLKPADKPNPQAAPGSGRGQIGVGPGGGSLSVDISDSKKEGGAADVGGFTFKTGQQTERGGRFDKVPKEDLELFKKISATCGSDKTCFEKKIFEYSEAAGALDTEYSKRLSAPLRGEILNNCSSKSDGVAKLFCARKEVSKFYGKLDAIEKQAKAESKGPVEYEAKIKELIKTDETVTSLVSGEPCKNSADINCRYKAYQNFKQRGAGALNYLGQAGRDGMIASMLAARCMELNGTSCVSDAQIAQINQKMVPSNWVMVSDYGKGLPEAGSGGGKGSMASGGNGKSTFDGSGAAKPSICDFITEPVKNTNCKMAVQAAQKNAPDCSTFTTEEDKKKCEDGSSAVDCRKITNADERTACEDAVLLALKSVPDCTKASTAELKKNCEEQVRGALLETQPNCETYKEGVERDTCKRTYVAAMQATCDPTKNVKCKAGQWNASPADGGGGHASGTSGAKQNNAQGGQGQGKAQNVGVEKNAGKGSDEAGDSAFFAFSAGLMPFPHSWCKNKTVSALSMGAVSAVCGADELLGGGDPEAKFNPPECRSTDQDNCAKDQMAKANPANVQGIKAVTDTFMGDADRDVRVHVEATKSQITKLALQYFQLQSHAGDMELHSLLGSCVPPENLPDKALLPFSQMGLVDAVRDAYEVAKSAEGGAKQDASSSTRTTSSEEDRTKYQAALADAAKDIQHYDQAIAAISKDLSPEDNHDIEEWWGDHIGVCNVAAKIADGAANAYAQSGRERPCNKTDETAAWLVDKHRYDQNGDGSFRNSTEKVCNVQDFGKTAADYLLMNYMREKTGEEVEAEQKAQDAEYSQQVAQAKGEAHEEQAWKSAEDRRRHGGAGPGNGPAKNAPEFVFNAPTKPDAVNRREQKNYFTGIRMGQRKLPDGSVESVPCQIDACVMKRSMKEELIRKRLSYLPRFPELFNKVGEDGKPNWKKGEGKFAYEKFSFGPNGKLAEVKKGGNKPEMDEATKENLSAIREGIAQLCRCPDTLGIKGLQQSGDRDRILGCRETPIVPSGSSEAAVRVAQLEADRCKFLHDNYQSLCVLDKKQQRDKQLAVRDKCGDTVFGVGSGNGIASEKMRENNSAINEGMGAIMDAKACIDIVKGVGAILKSASKVSIKAAPRFLATAAKSTGKSFLSGFFDPTNVAFTAAGAQGRLIDAGIGGGANWVAVQKANCAGGMWSQEQCEGIRTQSTELDHILKEEVYNAAKTALFFSGIHGAAEGAGHEYVSKRSEKLVEKLGTSEKKLSEAKKSGNEKAIAKAEKEVSSVKRDLAEHAQTQIAVEHGISYREAGKIPPEERVAYAKDHVNDLHAKKAEAAGKKLTENDRNNSWSEVGRIARSGEGEGKSSRPRDAPELFDRARESVEGMRKLGALDAESAKKYTADINEHEAALNKMPPAERERIFNGMVEAGDVGQKWNKIAGLSRVVNDFTSVKNPAELTEKLQQAHKELKEAREKGQISKEAAAQTEHFINERANEALKVAGEPTWKLKLMSLDSKLAKLSEITNKGEQAKKNIAAAEIERVQQARAQAPERVLEAAANDASVRDAIRNTTGREIPADAQPHEVGRQLLDAMVALDRTEQMANDAKLPTDRIPEQRKALNAGLDKLLGYDGVKDQRTVEAKRLELEHRLDDIAPKSAQQVNEGPYRTNALPAEAYPSEQVVVQTQTHTAVDAVARPQEGAPGAPAPVAAPVAAAHEGGGSQVAAVAPHINEGAPSNASREVVSARPAESTSSGLAHDLAEISSDPAVAKLAAEHDPQAVEQGAPGPGAPAVEAHPAQALALSELSKINASERVAKDTTISVKDGEVSVATKKDGNAQIQSAHTDANGKGVFEMSNGARIEVAADGKMTYHEPGKAGVEINDPALKKTLASLIPDRGARELYADGAPLRLSETIPWKESAAPALAQGEKAYFVDTKGHVWEVEGRGEGKKPEMTERKDLGYDANTGKVTKGDKLLVGREARDTYIHPDMYIQPGEATKAPLAVQEKPVQGERKYYWVDKKGEVHVVAEKGSTDSALGPSLGKIVHDTQGNPYVFEKGRLTPLERGYDVRAQVADVHPQMVQGQPRVVGRDVKAAPTTYARAVNAVSGAFNLVLGKKPTANSQTLSSSDFIPLSRKIAGILSHVLHHPELYSEIQHFDENVRLATEKDMARAQHLIDQAKTRLEGKTDIESVMELIALSKFESELTPARSDAIIAQLARIVHEKPTDMQIAREILDKARAEFDGNDSPEAAAKRKILTEAIKDLTPDRAKVFVEVHEYGAKDEEGGYTQDEKIMKARLATKKRPGAWDTRNDPRQREQLQTLLDLKVLGRKERTDAPLTDRETVRLGELEWRALELSSKGKRLPFAEHRELEALKARRDVNGQAKVAEAPAPVRAEPASQSKGVGMGDPAKTVLHVDAEGNLKISQNGEAPVAAGKVKSLRNGDYFVLNLPDGSRIVRDAGGRLALKKKGSPGDDIAAVDIEIKDPSLQKAFAKLLEKSAPPVQPKAASVSEIALADPAKTTLLVDADGSIKISQNGGKPEPLGPVKHTQNGDIFNLPDGSYIVIESGGTIRLRKAGEKNVVVEYVKGKPVAVRGAPLANVEIHDPAAKRALVRAAGESAPSAPEAAKVAVEPPRANPESKADMAKMLNDQAEALEQGTVLTRHKLVGDRLVPKDRKKTDKGLSVSGEEFQKLRDLQNLTDVLRRQASDLSNNVEVSPEALQYSAQEVLRVKAEQEKARRAAEPQGVVAQVVHAVKKALGVASPSEAPKVAVEPPRAKPETKADMAKLLNDQAQALEQGTVLTRHKLVGNRLVPKDRKKTDKGLAVYGEEFQRLRDLQKLTDILRAQAADLSKNAEVSPDSLKISAREISNEAWRIEKQAKDLRAKAEQKKTSGVDQKEIDLDLVAASSLEARAKVLTDVARQTENFAAPETAGARVKAALAQAAHVVSAEPVLTHDVRLAKEALEARMAPGEVISANYYDTGGAAFRLRNGSLIHRDPQGKVTLTDKIGKVTPLSDLAVNGALGTSKEFKVASDKIGTPLLSLKSQITTGDGGTVFHMSDGSRFEMDARGGLVHKENVNGVPLETPIKDPKTLALFGAKRFGVIEHPAGYLPVIDGAVSTHFYGPDSPAIREIEERVTKERETKENSPPALISQTESHNNIMDRAGVEPIERVAVSKVLQAADQLHAQANDKALLEQRHGEAKTPEARAEIQSQIDAREKQIQLHGAHVLALLHGISEKTEDAVGASYIHELRNSENRPPIELVDRREPVRKFRHSKEKDGSAEVFGYDQANDGEPLGKLEYRVRKPGANGSNAHILDIKTINTNVKGKGYSVDLYREMLARNPDATEIHSELGGDNKKAYLDARRGDPEKGILPKNHIDALKETPAYKAKAKLGFGVIDEALSVEVAGGKGDIPLVVKKGEAKSLATEPVEQTVGKFREIVDKHTTEINPGVHRVDGASDLALRAKEAWEKINDSGNKTKEASVEKARLVNHALEFLTARQGLEKSVQIAELSEKDIFEAYHQEALKLDLDNAIFDSRRQQATTEHLTVSVDARVAGDVNRFAETKIDSKVNPEGIVLNARIAWTNLRNMRESGNISPEIVKKAADVHQKPADYLYVKMKGIENLIANVNREHYGAEVQKVARRADGDSMHQQFRLAEAEARRVSSDHEPFVLGSLSEKKTPETRQSMNLSDVEKAAAKLEKDKGPDDDDPDKGPGGGKKISPDHVAELDAHPDKEGWVVEKQSGTEAYAPALARRIRDAAAPRRDPNERQLGMAPVSDELAEDLVGPETPTERKVLAAIQQPSVQQRPPLIAVDGKPLDEHSARDLRAMRSAPGRAADGVWNAVEAVGQRVTDVGKQAIGGIVGLFRGEAKRAAAPAEARPVVRRDVAKAAEKESVFELRRKKSEALAKVESEAEQGRKARDTLVDEVVDVMEHELELQPVQEPVFELRRRKEVAPSVVEKTLSESDQMLVLTGSDAPKNVVPPPIPHLDHFGVPTNPEVREAASKALSAQDRLGRVYKTIGELVERTNNGQGNRDAADHLRDVNNLSKLREVAREQREKLLADLKALPAVVSDAIQSRPKELREAMSKVKEIVEYRPEMTPEKKAELDRGVDALLAFTASDTLSQPEVNRIVELKTKLKEKGLTHSEDIEIRGLLAKAEHAPAMEIQDSDILSVAKAPPPVPTRLTDADIIESKPARPQTSDKVQAVVPDAGKSGLRTPMKIEVGGGPPETGKSVFGRIGDWARESFGLAKKESARTPEDRLQRAKHERELAQVLAWDAERKDKQHGDEVVTLTGNELDVEITASKKGPPPLPEPMPRFLLPDEPGYQQHAPKVSESRRGELDRGVDELLALTSSDAHAPVVEEVRDSDVLSTHKAPPPLVERVRDSDILATRPAPTRATKDPIVGRLTDWVAETFGSSEKKSPQAKESHVARLTRIAKELEGLGPTSRELELKKIAEPSATEHGDQFLAAKEKVDPEGKSRKERLAEYQAAEKNLVEIEKNGLIKSIDGIRAELRNAAEVLSKREATEKEVERADAELSKKLAAAAHDLAEAAKARELAPEEIHEADILETVAAAMVRKKAPPLPERAKQLAGEVERLAVLSDRVERQRLPLSTEDHAVVTDILNDVARHMEVLNETAAHRNLTIEELHESHLVEEVAKKAPPPLPEYMTVRDSEITVVRKGPPPLPVELHDSDIISAHKLPPPLPVAEREAAQRRFDRAVARRQYIEQAKAEGRRIDMEPTSAEKLEAYVGKAKPAEPTPVDVAAAHKAGDVVLGGIDVLDRVKMAETKYVEISRSEREKVVDVVAKRLMALLSEEHKSESLPKLEGQPKGKSRQIRLDGEVLAEVWRDELKSVPESQLRDYIRERVQHGLADGTIAPPEGREYRHDVSESGDRNAINPPPPAEPTLVAIPRDKPVTGYFAEFLEDMKYYAGIGEEGARKVAAEHEHEAPPLDAAALKDVEGQFDDAAAEQRNKKLAARFSLDEKAQAMMKRLQADKSVPEDALEEVVKEACE